MLFDEPKPHGFWLGKNTLAFLRNSLSVRDRCPSKSHRLCTALEVQEHTFPISLIIGGCTLILIGHTVTDCVVKQNCDLSRHGCDSLLFADPGRELPVERAQCGVASTKSNSDQSSERGCATCGNTRASRIVVTGFSPSQKPYGCHIQHCFDPLCEALGSFMLLGPDGRKTCSTSGWPTSETGKRPIFGNAYSASVLIHCWPCFGFFRVGRRSM